MLQYQTLTIILQYLTLTNLLIQWHEQRIACTFQTDI